MMLGSFVEGVWRETVGGRLILILRCGNGCVDLGAVKEGDKVEEAEDDGDDDEDER